MILWRGFIPLVYACYVRIYRTVKDICVPPVCWQCRYLLQISEQNQGLCQRCIRGIRAVAPSELIDRPHAISVYAAGGYSGVIQRLICAKKNNDISASRVMGKLIAARIIELRRCGVEYDVLVPVPLYWSRQAFRGYNQAIVIAHTIYEYTGIPVLPALKRTVYTVAQKGLSGTQRRMNVAGAFQLNKKYQAQLTGAHILLIDDLITTGSTLVHASRALRAARPRSIAAAVAGKVVL